MRVSRATFLKAFGTALLGSRVDARALLPGVVVAPGTPALPAAGAPPGLADARASIFRPYINTPFAVGSSDGPAARFVLAQVAERPVTRNVAQFSLIFHAPAGAAVPQGTHTLHHAALGAFDLFIVPINAPNRRRAVYQACFSRHLGAGDTRHGQAGASTLRRT